MYKPNNVDFNQKSGNKAKFEEHMDERSQKDEEEEDIDPDDFEL